jgi:nicotinamidase-related amidase
VLTVTLNSGAKKLNLEKRRTLRTSELHSQALLVVDVQPNFDVPNHIVIGIQKLASQFYTVATVERHDESVTPFERQLGWKPGTNDDSLIVADRVFVKHGYLPPATLIDHFQSRGVERVLVCGVQADTCCLAAGFMLFDAGLHPTLLSWLSVGSSLDRSGGLGASLWQHHFGSVLHSEQELGLSRFTPAAEAQINLSGTT